jgi:hypothetical protein
LRATSTPLLIEPSISTRWPTGITVPMGSADVLMVMPLTDSTVPFWHQDAFHLGLLAVFEGLAQVDPVDHPWPLLFATVWVRTRTNRPFASGVVGRRVADA